MSSNQYIQESLTRHQMFLQRYAGGISKDLTGTFRKLFADIDRRLSLEPSETEIERLLALERDLVRIINQYQLNIEIPYEFVEHEITYISELLDRATSAKILGVTPEVVFASVTGTPLKLYSTTGVITEATAEQLITRFNKGFNQRILNEIRAGYIAGDSVDEISRRILSVTGKLGPRQARTLTRTIINHYGTQARQAVLEVNRNIITGERFIATLDRRTTFICAGYDGQVFAIKQGPQPALHYG